MSQNTSTGAAPTPLPSGSEGIKNVFLKTKSFSVFFILPALLNGAVSHKKPACEPEDHFNGYKKGDAT
jgi:hypothetical protein